MSVRKRRTYIRRDFDGLFMGYRLVTPAWWDVPGRFRAWRWDKRARRLS